MGDPGARVGARPSPTGKRILSLFCGPFATCSPWWGLFHHVETFGYFFSMWGVFFVLMGGLFGLAPSPLRKFLRALMNIDTVLRRTS